MSSIDSAAQSGEWSQKSLEQLNNLIKDIKDGRIHFQRTVGERRSLSEGISAIHEGASLILRASYGTSPKKQGNSQEEYERDAKQGKEQERVIEAWAKAADLWLNDYTDEEGNNLGEVLGVSPEVAGFFFKTLSSQQKTAFGEEYRKLISKSMSILTYGIEL